MPERLSIVVPVSWSRRRLRVPVDVRLRFGDIAEREGEKRWFLERTRSLRDRLYARAALQGFDQCA